MTEQKTTDLNADNEQGSVSHVAAENVQSKRRPPPQHVIDNMNRVIIAAAKAGKMPGELADEVFREMFE